MAAIAALAAIVFLCLVGRHTWYAAGLYDGRRMGYKLGWKASTQAGATFYAQRMGRINVALGSLTLGDIAQALKEPTTDKVGALLARLDGNSGKLLGDIKARASEFTL